jgi:hypothetical protein
MTLEERRVADALPHDRDRAATPRVVAIIAGPFASARHRNYRRASSVVLGAGGLIGPVDPDTEEL